MKKLVYIALAILVVVGAWAVFAMNGMDKLGQKVAEATPTATPVEDASTSTGQAPSSTGDTQTVIVEGDEYAFSPEMINLKAGQKTVITYKNVGNMPHDLVIADLGVRTDVIGGGKETTVEFTPTKSGIFGFICSVGNHEALGMKGEVVVE